MQTWGESISRSEKSEYKGPEVGTHLACQRAGIAGAKLAQNKVRDEAECKSHKPQESLDLILSMMRNIRGI